MQYISLTPDKRLDSVVQNDVFSQHERELQSLKTVWFLLDHPVHKERVDMDV